MQRANIMAPIISSSHVFTRRMAEVTKPTDPITLIVEAWAQGFMVGAILIMLCITVSNYRRGVLLHKLILLELVFGSFHGTFIFNDAPVYGWYLSVTAIFLIISWNLHNVIAWIKVRPFIGRKTSMIFIGTIALVQPYWILEIYADFTYFNNISAIYLKTRVFEALFRDPWWVYTTCCLLYNIRTRYSFGLWELMCFSPRFAVMLIAMILSIIFTIIDICAVKSSFGSNIPIGINPFWKLAFVFKLLTDSVILDDFKTALDKLSARNISRVECQWAQDWATAKPMSDHRERRLTSLESSLNETKISRGPSEESSVLEHGQGIAVTREINVNSYAAERVELAMPLKCFNK